MSALRPKLSIHPAHVEEIAWMLAVHRGDELAAVEFRHRQRRHGEFGGEKIARGSDEAPRFDWQDSAAKDMVHFHLHLAPVSADEKFHLVAVFGADEFGRNPESGESFLRCIECRRDFFQRRANSSAHHPLTAGRGHVAP